MVQCKAEDTLTDEMKKAGHEEVSQQRLNYNAEIPNPLNLSNINNTWDVIEMLIFLHRTNNRVSSHENAAESA